MRYLYHLATHSDRRLIADRPSQASTSSCYAFTHRGIHTKYLDRTLYDSVATPTQMTAVLSTVNRVRSHFDDPVGGDEDRASGEGKAAVVDADNTQQQ